MAGPRKEHQCTGTKPDGKRCTKTATTQGRCHLHPRTLDGKQIGRPSTLTPQVTRQIAELVAEGNYPDVAAQSLGIARSTLYSWKERGEADLTRGATESPHAVFLDALLKAEAEAEVELRRQAQAAGPGAWQKYMTLMERRWRDRWAQQTTQKLEHSGHLERRGPDLSGLSDEDVEALDELLEKAEQHHLAPADDPRAE